MNQTSENRQRLLQKALLGNALFSTASGLTLLVASDWMMTFLGLTDRNSLIIVGISLLAFAASLLVNARRKTVKAWEARAAVFMDLAWVLVSYAMLFTMPFTSNGKWLVGVVGELVMAFAIVQWVGIRRITKSEPCG